MAIPSKTTQTMAFSLRLQWQDDENDDEKTLHLHFSGWEAHKPALVGYLCCSPVPKHSRDLLASRLTFGYNMIQMV
jgi:hypothetical protein